MRFTTDRTVYTRQGFQVPAGQEIHFLIEDMSRHALSCWHKLAHIIIIFFCLQDILQEPRIPQQKKCYHHVHFLLGQHILVMNMRKCTSQGAHRIGTAKTYKTTIIAKGNKFPLCVRVSSDITLPPSLAGILPVRHGQVFGQHLFSKSVGGLVLFVFHFTTKPHFR